MCEEAENGSKKKKGFFKTPKAELWCATSMVLLYAIWCVGVIFWAASRQLWNSQSLGCGLDTEFESRLENEAQLIYVWSGCNLVFCTLLMLGIWKRNSCCMLMYAALFFIFVAMVWTLINLVDKESQEIQTFQKKYLALLPFTETIKNPQINGGILTEMNCWQTQFKCCGLQGIQDWNTSFPDSCFDDEEQDNNWVRTTLLPRRNIYEKACFPTITSLVEKRSSAVWIITTVWLTIIAAPIAIFALGLVVGSFVGCCLFCEVSYKLSVLKNRICGGEKMVPVVFIRKNNNNQTEKEDMEAKESVWEDGVILEGLDDNPLKMIPVSLLTRLQEELDPPPVQHQVENSPCMCIYPPPKAIRQFYTVLIDDDSPLLPSNAVLVDGDKPTRFCWWEEGHRIFDAKDIVWPKDRVNRNTAC
ncbi:uncharacterized protein LOC110962737 [Acanthochromis polyacanthus]|uniref:uncharacterized protein LOC110962737 n=1 Tax=Acanthochromis polyacanthus TaxID=80966 RepID=UPI002234E863|nr:uncharacterized protein LOC110962737 [Acanthochromis polyacanthus]